MILVRRIILISISSLMIFSCSSIKPAVEPAPVELPVKPGFMEYYERGKTAFEIGDIGEAISLLNNSLEIRPDYVPSLELLAGIYLSSGKNAEAEELFNKVIILNSYSTSARLGIGRIALSKKLYDEALESFELVIGIEPGNAEAHFYKGLVLKDIGSVYRSITSMIRAVISDGSYRETVNSIYNLNDPENGKLFQEEYLEIEHSDAVSRAELAGLLATIVKNGRVFSDQMIGPQFTPPQMEMEESVMDDVPEKHWADEEITTVVQAGLLEVFPDKKFKPETKVNKADFATVLQTIIIRISGDQSIVTRYVGGNSPYTDLNSAHWAYNAARLSEEMGLLSRRDQGLFGISDNVDGLTVIKALENISRQ